ncbi:molybdate ABC transporter ATP-binding protein ModF [Enterobacteriaceae bacterium ESL0689]|nr:molybdate ABC transporter ATP-binding protein ModF [Enterobacteriaceae bacterium ESL0689]
MLSLQISQGVFYLSANKTLTIAHLAIAAGESWAFVGSNGSGKSALARVLSREITRFSGQYENHFSRIARLSFEQLQKLVGDEWQRNNTDLLSPGEEDSGRTTAEIIELEHQDPARCATLAELFGITHLLPRRFKYLSTGETRKTLLCQTLMTQPDLLILDEPFDGLDVASRQQLAGILATLNEQGITVILVLNRFSDIPDFVRFAGVLADCTLSEYGEKNSLLNQALIAQLAHSEKLEGITLPEPDLPAAGQVLADDTPRVILRDGMVSYNDKPVIQHLNWTVNPGEHWQIVGPNGAGKSTLLSLITGDHPQGYSNDLTLFGRRRGSGETIWDIKKHIGYVSSLLHLEYRVSTTVRNVILSGYFDSIGIYQAVSDRQRQLVQRWLDILGIDATTADAPFHTLSWGQQRLALIVRALVKHPTLLILDEPLQGLDPLNRQLVRRFIDVLIQQGNTQLLFVSHHREDAPACITHRLIFIPDENGYSYQFERCAE